MAVRSKPRKAVDAGVLFFLPFGNRGEKKRSKPEHRPSLISGKAKKGVFFTLIAIMLMTIIAIGFTPREHLTYKDRLPAVTARIDVANNYVKTLKYSYMQSAVETSGRDAMSALVLFINRTTYLPDFNSVNSTFIEILLNGSINGTPVECFTTTSGNTGIDSAHIHASDPSCIITPQNELIGNKSLFTKLSAMENATIRIMLINTEFKKSMNDYSVIVYQDNTTGPWKFGVNLTTNYTVNAGIAYWNVTQTVSATVPIEGLLDPVYLVNASINHTIRATNSTVWNASNLSKLIDEQKYRYVPEGYAPSFLMRLSYNMSNGGLSVSGSECCGIESPIKPSRLSVPQCTRKSYIDWCFFSSSCAPDRTGPKGASQFWNVKDVTTYSGEIGRYDGFKLDDDHGAKTYNFTSLGDLYAIDTELCPP